MASGSRTMAVNIKEEDREKYRQMRARGRAHMFKMAVIQLGLGSVSCAIGIASLIVGVPTGSFPYVLGVGLWVGVLVFVAGVFAFKASRQTDTPDGQPTGTDRCFVIVHYVFSLLSIIISVVMPVFGGLGIFYCLNPGSFVLVGRGSNRYRVYISCEPNYEGNLALSGLTLGVGILVFISSIVFTTYFCCYARAYGFVNRRQQQREIMRLQQQVNHLQKQIPSQDNYAFSPY